MLNTPQVINNIFTYSIGAMIIIIISLDTYYETWLLMNNLYMH